MRWAGRPGLLNDVMRETIPMHGRMVHGENGGELFEQSQAYDVHGRVRTISHTMCSYGLLVLLTILEHPSH